MGRSQAFVEWAMLGNNSEKYMSNNGDLLVNEEWVPLAEIEGRYVAKVLAHTRGNKQAAARVLRRVYALPFAVATISARKSTSAPVKERRAP